MALRLGPRYTVLSKEARCCLLPFSKLPRPLYWFNDKFEPYSWSMSHVHNWGELAYVGHGGMVIYTEEANYLASPGSAV